VISAVRCVVSKTAGARSRVRTALNPAALNPAGPLCPKANNPSKRAKVLSERTLPAADCNTIVSIMRTHERLQHLYQQLQPLTPQQGPPPLARQQLPSDVPCDRPVWHHVAAGSDLSLSSTIALRSGAQMPLFGLGTAVGHGPPTPDNPMGSGGEQCVTACSAALRQGYRLLDTAAAYENEEEVGAAIKVSGIPRAELFVVTKLAVTAHGRAATRAALEDSLAKLGLDRLD
jgi:hypothetical protein